MKQIWFVSLFAALLGCSEMIPGTCYLNPTGGAGGGGSIPSTSVGATSGTGDFASSPENEPLGAGDGEDGSVYYGVCVSDNPCEVCPQTAGLDDRYTADHFHFVTTIPDDGTGESGGWQEAKVLLGGKRERYWPRYYEEKLPCPQMTFKMPLRNVKQGKISPTKAARVSARVANDAAAAVFAEDYFIKRGLFCIKFKDELQQRLPMAVSGASVSQP